MIYLLYGEEQYLVQEEYSRILKKHEGASLEKIDSPTFASLVEEISIPSLFAPNRVIVVSNLDLSQDSDDIFISSISKLSPGVTLILKNPDELDKRSKIYKALASIAEVHEFKPIPQWEEDMIADFIVKAFKDNGKTISRDNAYILVEGVGRNLGLLSSEVKKISTYVGAKTTVEKSDIETLMTRAGWDSFALVDQIVKKKVPGALLMLERLLRDNEDPIGLLSLLSSQYRMLFKVKLLSQKGETSAQIARRLKASPYYINRLYENASGFKLDELGRGMESIYNVDLKLKSGYSGKSELSLLIADLMSNA